MFCETPPVKTAMDALVVACPTAEFAMPEIGSKRNPWFFP
jgi:hypothetical protein